MSDEEQAIAAAVERAKERQELRKAIDATPSWGAAVGARYSRLADLVRGFAISDERALLALHARCEALAAEKDCARNANEEGAEIVGELKARVTALEGLIATLSDCLTDEGSDWTNNGLATLRKRVADALPDSRLPDWLRPYRTHAALASATEKQHG